MNKIFSKLLGGAVLLCLSASLFSCEDLFGEWNPPAPVIPAPAARVTTAPVATTDDVIAGLTTALVTPGEADGGKMMYAVTTTNIKPTTTDGFNATVPTAEGLTASTYYVWYYAKADAMRADSEISASPIEVTVLPTLNTPLTLEVLTAGTIIVNNPASGMQYSLNGGAKTAVPNGISINGGDLNVGDKVAFYGDGTNIICYGVFGTNITGSAEVKVYGNIMSLVDEMGFATADALSKSAFPSLFANNSTLKDASGLLLPATKLSYSCYHTMFYGCTALVKAPKNLPAETLEVACYFWMFKKCTSLIATPKLPATTLALQSYNGVFSDCTSLTNAYVKACYANSSDMECYNMFQNCSATAVMHTTSDSQSSWQDMMGSGKTWSTWTVVADWN